MRSSIRDVVAFFDALTRRAGKDIWLEKTPRHVLHASRILRLVPDSRFIHIVRDGRDVVASIVDRARRNPDRFRGQEDPAYGIRQWNRSIGATASALEDPGHLVLRYEALADRGEETLRALCLQIGIEFEEGMLEPGRNRAFILKEETWKAPRKGPIRRADSKFEVVFDEKTRARINDRLDQRFLEVIDGHIRSAPGQVWASRQPS
jgi:hypothetical protein